MMKQMAQLSLGLLLIGTAPINGTVFPDRNMSQKWFEEQLEEYRALHHRHKTVVKTINDIRSGGGLGKPLLAGITFGGLAAAAAHLANQPDETSAGAGVVVGVSSFFIAAIAQAIYYSRKDLSEYEKERDHLAKAFLDKECSIITQGSQLGKEYIEEKVQHEQNVKLKEILRDLLVRR